jgi:hypothetical protein
LRRVVTPLTVALPLLIIAYFTGAFITDHVRVDLSEHMKIFSSGFEEIRIFLADLLYLQIDRYHHIMTYQGYDWRVITDYLPQLWLITKLNPTFSEAYIEGGNHLAVNLGYVEEGLQVLREGLRNCPNDPAIVWEYAYVSWKTGALPPRELSMSLWNFLALERRSDLLAVELTWYTNAMNARRLLWWTFEDYTDHADHIRIAECYRISIELMMQIRGLCRAVQEDLT